MESETFLNVSQVAERLGVPVSWVYSACESGRIPSYRLGKYVRIDSKEFEAWLRAQRAIPIALHVIESDR